MSQLCRSVPGVKRGCGYRQEGGVYIESGIGPGGVPLEHFIFDVPQALEINIKVGVQLWTDPKTHVTHVVDWVGTKHYPYATDIIEEGRRYGFSRKVSPHIKWQELDERSRLLLVHERGLVSNYAEYAFELSASPDTHKATCAMYRRETMKRQPDLFGGLEHVKYPALYPCNCYQYLAAKFNKVRLVGKPGTPDKWLDHFTRDMTPMYLEWELENLETATGVNIKDAYERVEYYREHGSTSYRVYTAFSLERYSDNGTLNTAEYQSAVIVGLPITNVSCIRAADGQKHLERFAHVRARTSPLIDVSIANA